MNLYRGLLLLSFVIFLKGNIAIPNPRNIDEELLNQWSDLSEIPASISIYEFSLTVPKDLLNFGAPFNGTYQSFINNINYLSSTCLIMSDLNISTKLSYAVVSSSEILNGLLEFSGPIADVLDSFSIYLRSTFETFANIIINYTYVLGYSLTDLLLEELYLYQVTLLELVASFSNAKAINANVIEVVNKIEYILLTQVAMAVTALSNRSIIEYDEVFVSLSILVNTACILSFYINFLVIPVVTDPDTLKYIGIVLSMYKDDIEEVSVQSLPNILRKIAKSTTDEISFTKAVFDTLSLMSTTTITFASILQLIPNEFSHYNLIVGDTATNLAHLQTALSQVHIGAYSGTLINELIADCFK